MPVSQGERLEHLQNVIYGRGDHGGSDSGVVIANEPLGDIAKRRQQVLESLDAQVMSPPSKPKDEPNTSKEDLISPEVLSEAILVSVCFLR